MGKSVKVEGSAICTHNQRCTRLHHPIFGTFGGPSAGSMGTVGISGRASAAAEAASIGNQARCAVALIGSGRQELDNETEKVS